MFFFSINMFQKHASRRFLLCPERANKKRRDYDLWIINVYDCELSGNVNTSIQSAVLDTAAQPWTYNLHLVSEHAEHNWNGYSVAGKNIVR